MRTPTKEERQLFRDAMSDVRPLATPRLARTAPPPRKRSPVRPARTPSLAATQPRSTSRIEATLDLHGLTAEAARRRLQEFIDDARTHDLRRVRIVHGKGLRSGTAGPVLRAVVEHTLKSIEDVEAIEPARPADGGAGAVVVRLRDAAMRRGRRRR